MFFYLMFLTEKNRLSPNLSKRWISPKENLNKCTSFEEQKGTSYIRENNYFGIIIFSCLSSTKQDLRFLSNCFALEIKGFYRSSLGNKVDFRDIMNLSPNILAKNQNFKKLRHDFVDERALITTRLISSCHWKTYVPFWLRKKRPENTFFNTTSAFSQRRTEKQIMLFKTTVNPLLKDIWYF